MEEVVAFHEANKRFLFLLEFENPLAKFRRYVFQTVKLIFDFPGVKFVLLAFLLFHFL